MRTLWRIIKIVGWSLAWFIGQVLYIVSIGELKGVRDKSYRKIVFIAILGRREEELREAQMRYRNIESGIAAAEDKHGIRLFGNEGS